MFTAHPLIDAMHAVHGIPPVSPLTEAMLSNRRDDTTIDASTTPRPGVLVRWRAFRMRNAHPRPQP